MIRPSPRRRRLRLPLALVAGLTASACAAASLDDLRPGTCRAIDGQLTSGAPAVELFNATSQASIAAFRAGRHEEGCRLFLSVRQWVEGVTVKLGACAAASAIAADRAQAERFRVLRAGFVDLHAQLVRVDRREACSPRS